MSIADVADALFLHPNKIEALESDTFDHLASPTFVRGYLRGYARVVGLPSAPILEMYDRQGFRPPPLAPEISETKQAHTSDLPIRLVTWAVGAVLVLLVGLWWRSQGDNGFDIGGDLLGWWSNATSELPFPGTEAPATAPASSPAEGPAPAGFPPETPAPDGSDAGGRTVAMAPDRAGGPSQDDEPPVSSPAGGPAPADIPSDAPVPDGSDAGGRTVAMAPDRAGGSPQGDEPPASSPVGGPAPADIPSDAPAPDGSDTSGRIVAMAPDRAGGPPQQGGESPASPLAGGPAPADIPPDAPVPDGSDAGGRTVAMAPDRAGGSPQGDEPPVSSPAEGPAIAGTGPVPAEGAGPASVDGVGRPEAPEPRDTRQADATDGPDATAAPGAVTPPSIPETSPPETDSTPSDVAAVATAVAETAQSGLVLAFAHESWVEVFDRERNRLFFGLVQPGRVLDFDGPRPFDVLLGNSNDVRVTIDGEAFDHTPYVRHGVARFSVGASPAGRADAAEPSDTVATDAGDSREAPSQPRDDNAR